jgi:ferredoxin/flavodoxin---NADP+ reductase
MEYTYYHNIHRVEDIKFLTNSTFIVRFERKRLNFIPGQHLVVGLKGDHDFRQYSIYSGLNDPFFEILVKEVIDGTVTPKLSLLNPGDELEINGPMGHFTLNETRRNNHPVVFIATGTGIAPFKSMVSSYPSFDYRIIHGVRNARDAYQHEYYPKEKYIMCTSGESTTGFYGRVTDFISNQYFDPDTLFYMCGNSQMIFDTMEILRQKGANPKHLIAEVYF